MRGSAANTAGCGQERGTKSGTSSCASGSTSAATVSSTSAATSAAANHENPDPLHAGWQRVRTRASQQSLHSWRGRRLVDRDRRRRRLHGGIREHEATRRAGHSARNRQLVAANDGGADADLLRTTVEIERAATDIDRGRAQSDGVGVPCERRARAPAQYHVAVDVEAGRCQRRAVERQASGTRKQSAAIVLDLRVVARRRGRGVVGQHHAGCGAIAGDADVATRANRNRAAACAAVEGDGAAGRVSDDPLAANAGRYVAIS